MTNFGGHIGDLATITLSDDFYNLELEAVIVSVSEGVVEADHSSGHIILSESDIKSVEFTSFQPLPTDIKPTEINENPT
jgi:serine phosphatase RsbU (regulator of sigma subunit)